MQYMQCLELMDSLHVNKLCRVTGVHQLFAPVTGTVPQKGCNLHYSGSAQDAIAEIQN